MACILLVVLLSSCTFGSLDPQGLMAAPTTNADQQAIYKLLQGNRSEITFAFPKNGDYRSAITMVDFTGDGLEDAIGFSLSENGSAEVQFLTKDTGQWITLNHYGNAATQVDRILFGDLTGNGLNDIIIGWGNSQNLMSATLCVYIYENGVISEVPLDTNYGALSLTDFDGDDVQELFLMQRFQSAADENTDHVPAKAELFTYQDGKMVSCHQQQADNSITQYNAISYGMISQGQYGVVVDGAKADGSSSTQVFFIQDGVFSVFPPNLNEENSNDLFYRPSRAAFVSRDLDGDGILEIPVIQLLPALSSDIVPDSTSFQVHWVQMDRTYGYRSVCYTLMNTGENYYFEIPSWYVGSVTAINDSRLRAVTYYAVENPETEASKSLLGSRLFTIRVFNKTAWEQRGLPGGYEMLTQQGDLIYGVVIHNTENGFGGLIDSMRARFQLLGE